MYCSFFLFRERRFDCGIGDNVHRFKARLYPYQAAKASVWMKRSRKSPRDFDIDLRDTTLLRVSQHPDQCNHIQPKFPMWQCPTPLFATAVLADGNTDALCCDSDTRVTC